MSSTAPVALTSFVGRRDELAAVRRLLDRRRLVTLTGVGGSGKTRLAAEVCARLDDRGADGVGWVDLSAVTDPELVPRVVAGALGVLVDPDRDPLQVIVQALRPHRLLLCLDTCEHLLDAAAELARSVLQACPDVSVLATSREPLGVPGEAVWPVPPLEDGDARRLFVDRAALVAPWFSTSTYTDEVGDACRRVDGIPLAIELAAAWVRVLSPAQIVAGLDSSFRLLAGGARGVVPRHQTLIASLDWSHELLDEAERALFRRLSVFVGGFTLEAAVAVGGPDAPDVLAMLGRLVDKSLVAPRPWRAEVRYRMLDTIRQYAGAKLREAGEGDEIRDRHLAHFLALAEEAEIGLDRDQDAWRAELDGQHDDIAAAARWGLGTPGRHEPGRRLCAAMSRQWMLRGQAHEALEFLGPALDLAPDERSALQARLLAGQAMIAMVAGRRELGVEASARGMAMAEEVGAPAARARCLATAAYGEFFVDFPLCQRLATEAHELGASVGDAFARDWGAILAGYSLTARDRHTEAVVWARTALEASRPGGDRWMIAFALGIEVFAAMYGGDVRGAMALAADAAATVAPLGDYFAVGTMTSHAALAFILGGDLERARELAEPSTRVIEQTPDADAVGLMVGRGHLELSAGKLEDAVRWFERGIDPHRMARDDWTAARCYPGLVGALRRLGRHEEAAEHAARGLVLARDRDSPYLRSALLEEQGYLEADPARHHEALAVRRESGLTTFVLDSLDALARVALRAERPAEAARLLAASDAARALSGYPRPPVDRPDHEATVAAVRAALGDEAFQAATAEGAGLSVDDAVTLASRGRGQRQRPPSGWASLTPTEREVVDLVLEGLTNPEIARRLFVSRATVKTHLSHIYAKLNVANRTGLAAFASRTHPEV